MSQVVVEVISGRVRKNKDAAARALPAMDAAVRIERLRERLAHERCGGMLVTSLSNVRYLCGFSGSVGMLLVTAGRASFYTDGRYGEQAANELARVGVDAEIVVLRNSERLGSISKATRNLARLAIEADDVTWSFERSLEDVIKPQLVPTSGFVEELRVVKDAGELARIERACEVADVAFAQTKERLTEEPSERDFAAELEFEMKRRGADEASFGAIVASGPNAAMPHAKPTARLIVPGELVVIDFGATVDGYHSDMTRTVCVGDPSAEAAAVLDAVAASQRAGLLAVAAGVGGAEVDQACRKSLDDAGFGAAFVHGTGHGVGLDIHERPSLGRASTDILEEGAVVTIEPGVYLSGKFGARIEDTVVVTSSGCRPLTKTTKDATI